MTISEIKRIRRQLKWTYARFSQEMGIHLNTIYRWETGKCKPSQLALRQMELLRQTLLAKGLLKGKKK